VNTTVNIQIADLPIIQRRLAEAQEELQRADEHARTLSAEIERLRGELDAVPVAAMRWYWRNSTLWADIEGRELTDAEERNNDMLAQWARKEE
jgi:hypothetical protein